MPMMSEQRSIASTKSTSLKPNIVESAYDRQEHVAVDTDTDPLDDALRPDPLDPVWGDWQNSDAFSGYVSGSDLPLDDSLGENGVSGLLDGREEYRLTSQANLSFSQRRRLAQGRDAVGQAKDEIDEDWFEEGAAREAFTIIRDHALNLQLHKPSLPKDKLQYRMDALAFFFVETNLTSFSLDECCAAIDHSVRPDVLRLRLTYEFYLRWLRLPQLPVDSVGIPQVILNRLAFAARVQGDLEMLTAIWFAPGIDAAAVIQAAEPQSAKHTFELQTCLAKWEEAGLIACQGEHTYLTGRNPQGEFARHAMPGTEGRARASTISWSRLF